jgi:Gram-negative porin
MKKTLVALAALAAVGSSFAQSTVNLTGTYAAGYESNKFASATAGVAAVTNAGLGTDTASVQFSAVEDMGAGMKVSAKVSAGGLVRAQAVGGEDANVTFSGGFGSFYLTTFESAGSGVHQIASAGVPGYDLQGRVFGANANIDLIGYSSWDMSGFKFHVNYVDRGNGASAGLSAGTDGSTVANPSFGLAGTYTQGPINARLDYTGWTRLQDAGVTLAAASQPKDRVRLSGTYDFGMAKIGLGFSTLNRDGKSDDSAGPQKTGYTVGGQYDLSKRTNVGASLYSWKQESGTAATNGDYTGFRVLVAHSF